MSILLDSFGGIIPRTNPEKLPDIAAQVAHNADVTSGVLVPLSARGPFVALHDTNGDLNADVPVADVVSITKPTTPSESSREYICKPNSWLRIYAYDWVSYVGTGQNRLVFQTRNQYLPIQEIKYTETGLEILTYLWRLPYTFLRGFTYFVRGPRYRFVFSADTENGGPEQAVSYPLTASEGDPEFPRQRTPLIDSNSNVYADFQCTDVYGPKFDADILVTDYDYVFYWLPNSFFAYVVFTINLNYAVSKRTHVFYAQTMVTAAEQEGPPSEISGRITVKPGEVVTLLTPRSSGYVDNNLYRSETQGGDDFRLVDNVNAEDFIDDNPTLKAEKIPPFGNFPSTVAVADFLKGSKIHPAQFGVAFNGKTVYHSDYERFHSWPDENTQPYEDEVVAIAISGNSTLVFSGDNVYAEAGNNPKALTVNLLSATTPILNVQSMCQIGQVVYFATHDGLAAATAGGVQIVSRNHFTREQWGFMGPENMICKTGDNSLFIETTTSSETQDEEAGSPVWVTAPTQVGTSTNNPFQPNTDIILRFDFDDDQLIAITTASALTDGQMLWRSKRFWFDQETTFEYAQILADDYPVTLRVYANRELAGDGTTFEVLNDQPFALSEDSGETDDDGNSIFKPFPHARQWEFEIVSSGNIVRKAYFYDKVVSTIGDVVRLTPQNTPNWRSVWVKFPDRDTFVGGVLSVQISNSTRATTVTRLPIFGLPKKSATGSVSVNLYYGNGELAHTQDVGDGHFFTLPRTLKKDAFFRIDVQTPNHIDELVLFRRQTESVGNTLHIITDGGIPPWLLRRYEFADLARLKSLIVHATGSVTMNLYFDGATTPSDTLTIEDSQEIRLAEFIVFDPPTTTSYLRYSSIEFDFSGNDADVTEVILQMVDVQQVSVDGVTLTGDRGWRRNLVSFPDRGVFVCGSLASSSYPVRLNLYGDGESVLGQDVANGNVFVLPRDLLDEFAEWEIDVEQDAEISSLTLLSRRPVPVSGKNIHVLNSRNFPEWLFSRYEFLQSTVLESIRIVSDENVTANIYLDGSEEPTKRIELVSGIETLLDNMAACNSLEIDFVIYEEGTGGGVAAIGGGPTSSDGPTIEDTRIPGEQSVRELFLFGRDTQVVGDNGISLSGRRNWRNLSFKFDDRGSFVCGSLGATNYDDITLTFSADGVEVHTETVTDGNYFTLPRGLVDGSYWTIDIDAGTAEVETLVLLPRRPERSDDHIQVVHGNSIPRWLYTRYEFAGPRWLGSVFVEADSYPVTMAIYCDADTEVATFLTISDSSEVRIPISSSCGSVDFEFYNTSTGARQDHLVRDVSFYSRTSVLIGDGGIVLGASQSWIGLRFKFKDRGVFSCGSVGATKYVTDTGSDNITLNFYDINGTQVHTESIGNGNVFTLPRTLEEMADWEVEVVTDAEVTSLILLPRTRKQFVVREIARDTGLPPWLWSRYEITDMEEPKSVIVHADSDAYPITMNLYADGSESVTKAVEIEDATEVRLTGLAPYSAIDYDFVDVDSNPIDYLVNEVFLFTKKELLVGEEGIRITGPSFRGHLAKFLDGGTWACGILNASSYPRDMKIRFYKDGATFPTVYDVLSNTVFSLLDVLDHDDDGVSWEIDVEAPAGVELRSLVLMPWRRVHVGQYVNAGVNGTNDLRIPPWLYTRYQFAENTVLRSGKVVADEDSYNFNIDLYRDRDTSKKRTTVRDELEFTFASSVGEMREVIVHFGDEDRYVRQFFLFGEESIPISNRGFFQRSVQGGIQPWQNKVLRFPEMGSFSVARIVADDYSGLKLRLLVSGSSKYFSSVSSSDEFLLPTSLPNARDWELQIEHQGAIHEVMLIGRQEYAVADGYVVVRREDDPFTWLDRRTLSPTPVNFTCARIVADDYPVTFRLYDKNRTNKIQKTVRNEQAFRLPRRSPNRTWIFDAVQVSGELIQEVSLSTSMARLGR